MEVQLKRPTPGDASPAQSNNQLKDGMQEQHVVMMSCKAKPGKSMGVKAQHVDGMQEQHAYMHAVIFIGTSETDINQQWFMDYNCGLKDAEGKPGREAFAIVNLGTGMAIQNPEKAEQPVRLVPYIRNQINPDVSLWTAEDTQNGFKIIREYKGGLKIIRNLVLAAAHQGLQVVVSNYNAGDSRQLWRIQERIG